MRNVGLCLFIKPINKRTTVADSNKKIYNKKVFHCFPFHCSEKPEALATKSELVPRKELISGENCNCITQTDCYWLNDLNKFSEEIESNSEWKKKVDSLISNAR